MRRTKLSTFAVLVAGVSLAACGGGTPPGSAPASTNVTLAGVVAAGAPLIGYVSIKDSAGASVVGYLDENGGYSADISELSAPYLLYASGTVGTKVYTLLSAATEADHDKTVNITPLTDLIVANVVGQSAVEFYNTPDFSKITTAALEAQEDVLEARLRPLLDAAGVAADFDLRNSAFTPDHTGIDAVLDVITVEVDATTDIATITNILDSTQTITDDLADSSDNTELGAGTVTLTTLGEIQTLTDGMEGVAVLHASNVTDPAQFAPALADGLSFDGASKDDLLELFINPDPTARQMVTNYMEGTKVFSLKSMDLAATTPVAWVTFGGESSAVKFTKTGANGEWQFAGNDRGVNVSLMAETFKSGSGVHYVLTPDVGDFSAEITGTARNMLPGDYFVVTGPGLPTAGLVLIQSAFNDTNNASTPGMAGEGWGYGRTEAQLLAGGVVDGSVYTFVWYRDVGLDTTFRVDGTILSTDIATGIAADTVVDSYTTTLAKRPPASTETAYFPAITVPTSSDTATFADGSLAVSWTLPEGSSSDVVWLDVSYSDGTESRDAESIVADTATSTALTVNLDATKTVSAARLYVSTRDAFGRHIVAQLGMSPSASTAPDPGVAPAGIVGSWSAATTPTKPTLVLNADNTFSWMELGGAAPNGIESGTYTADASNIITTVTVDGIGTPMAQDGGIDNNGNPLNFTYSYNSTTDELTLNFPPNPDGSAGMTFLAVRTRHTGALVNGAFDLVTNPEVIVFYPNGKYFQWCNSSTLTVCDVGYVADNIEIGNYSVSGQTITMGAKDYDVGAYGFYDGLTLSSQFVGGNATTGAADLEITFNVDPAFTVAKSQLKDTAKPIVGAWHLGATADFDPASSDVIVFYADGTYFQWTNNNNTTASCTGVTAREEIGTYTFNGTTLDITSHIRNGVGGFDDALDCTQPAGAITASVSTNGKTVTLPDWGATLTRVE